MGNDWPNNDPAESINIDDILDTELASRQPLGRASDRSGSASRPVIPLVPVEVPEPEPKRQSGPQGPVFDILAKLITLLLSVIFILILVGCIIGLLSWIGGFLS